MKKILVVFGTRPEAIKMAPIIKELLLNKEYFETKICVTAQHREMLDQVLNFFEIIPDYDLNIMTHNQNLSTLTSDIILKMKGILEDSKPDYVFVHGDTTTTMATSLATYYYGSKLCHIEAGLRTYNKRAPFPEEINRVLTSHLADYHFAPTEGAKENLIKENINPDTVIVTGNTVIDALLTCVDKVRNHTFQSIEDLSNLLDEDKEIILLTMHRRENHGEGLELICEALNELTEKTNVQIVYPVHKNPNIYVPVHDFFGKNKNIKLIEPLPYEAFVWLMDKAKIIITDSGGIQEEAPSLGKPVLVLREITERPESVVAGTVIIVGSNKKKIIDETMELLHNKDKYHNMTLLHNPYGDGTAAKQIIKYLKNI